MGRTNDAACVGDATNYMDAGPFGLWGALGTRANGETTSEPFN